MLYWTFDFNGKTDMVDFHEHAINSLITLIDLMLSRWPLFLRHLYFPWAYNLTYLCFMASYIFLNGRDQVRSFALGSQLLNRVWWTTW